MGLIQKLNEIKTIKNDIKDAIIEKGGVLEDATPFSNYAGEIRNIQTGEEDFNIKNCRNLFANGDRSDIFNSLIKYVNNPTNCYGMMNGFDNITQEQLNCLKNIDFSLCSNMYSMLSFRKETAIIPELKNTKNVYNMSNMFRTLAASGIPRKREFNHIIDIKNCSSLSYTFDGVYFINNTDSEVPIKNFDNITNLAYTFNNTDGIESFTQFDTSKVGNFNYTFYKSKSLKRVDINISKCSSNMMQNTFDYCTLLNDLKFTGTTNVKTNFNVSSTGLTRNGIMNMLATLPTLDHTQTITIGSTKMNLLTDEDIAEFTAKGYTLA